MKASSIASLGILTGGLLVGMSVGGVVTAQTVQGEVVLTADSYSFGVIPAGARSATQMVVVDSAAEARLVLVSTVKLTVEITRPDGGVITRDNAVASGVRMMQVSVAEQGGLVSLPGVGVGEQTVVILSAPPAGSYSVRVDAGMPVLVQTPFTIGVDVDSDVRMALSAPEPEIVTGTPSVVTAVLFEGVAPVVGATITATVYRNLLSTQGTPVPFARLPLLDDGSMADVSVGDGVYSAVIPVLLPPGLYTIVAHADGISTTGNVFKRDSSVELRVSERNARIASIDNYAGVDDNNNDLFDRLRVNATLETSGSNQFDLSLLLRARNGRTVASNVLGRMEIGSMQVSVDFPADYILGLGADGPYTITLARLDEITTSERILRDRLGESVVISGLRLAQFEGFISQLPGADVTPPVIAVTDDIVVEATEASGAIVSYSAPTFEDNVDGSGISMCSPISGSLFPLGRSGVACSAVDTAGNRSSIRFMVTVRDRMPPTVTSLSVSPSILWPPNHKMVRVSVVAVVSDVVDLRPTCTIVSIAGNEPVDGMGGDETGLDWAILENMTAKLRAARSGQGNGRIYTISGRCTDASRNSSTWNVEVRVPHNR